MILAEDADGLVMTPEQKAARQAAAEQGRAELVRRIVDAWPPLTEEQIARISVLLFGTAPQPDHPGRSAVSKKTDTATGTENDTTQLPRLAWSPREVAEQFGLPYETVLDAIHAGTIPALRIGRHYRVPAADLTRMLNIAKR